MTEFRTDCQKCKMDLGFWPVSAAKFALLDHFVPHHPCWSLAAQSGGRTSLVVAHRNRAYHYLTTDGLHRGLVRMNLREVVVPVEAAVDDLVAYYGKTF